LGRRKTIPDEELLAAAREAFIEEGIGISTRAIAKRAGISEGVLFQRFGTKIDMLFKAMVPPPLDVAALIEQGAADGDVCAHLESVALGMMAYFRSLSPMLMTLASHPSFNYETFIERHPDAPFLQMQNALMGHLEQLQAEGQVECDHLGHVVLSLLATIHGMAIFERLGAHGGSFTEDDIRFQVRNLWWGIAPGRVRPGRVRPGR